MPALLTLLGAAFILASAAAIGALVRTVAARRAKSARDATGPASPAQITPSISSTPSTADAAVPEVIDWWPLARPVPTVVYPRPPIVIGSGVRAASAHHISHRSP